MQILWNLERSKLFKVVRSLPLTPPRTMVTFATFAINHGRQVVGLYSRVSCIWFLFSYPFFFAFSFLVFSYLVFVLRRQHFLNLPSSYLSVWVCLFREASQKHKSKRQDKFRRSAVGSLSFFWRGETFVASFLPLLFLLMIYAWHAIGWGWGCLRISCIQRISWVDLVLGSCKVFAVRKNYAAQQVSSSAFRICISISDSL